MLFKHFLKESELLFGHIPEVKHFADVVGIDVVNRELKGATPDTPEQEIIDYVTNRIRDVEYTKKMKQEVSDDDEYSSSGKYYRVLGNDITNGLKVNKKDGEYYIHATPTLDAAKRWIPTLVEDDFLNPGKAKVISIDLQVLNDMGIETKVVDDNFIMDATNTPPSVIIKLNSDMIPLDAIQVLDTIIVNKNGSYRSTKKNIKETILNNFSE